jgi:hypothetical protein
VTDWIQAASALVVAIATGVLVWITIKYVRLTSQLAQAAGYEMQVSKARDIAQMNELSSLVLRIWRDLNALPVTSGMDLRQGTIPTEADLALLRTRASSISRRASSYATIVDSNVAWLRDRLQDVRREPSRAFDWPGWEKRVDQALSALGEVLAEMGETEPPEE